MAVDKLVDSSQLNSDLTSVANAIRAKGGTSASLAFPSGFVAAIGAIPSGGSATLITKNITANGTYNASSDNADGYSSVTVAVPSKLITGTFTGTASGATTVSIPYTGSGYPIWLVVYPVNGTNKSGDTWAELVQRYAEGVFMMVKNNISSAPTYNDTTAEANKAMVIAYYKSSASDATSITSGAALAKPFYRNNNAAEAYGDCVRLKSNTEMSVYIANTSYGFAKNIEYAYAIMYSA